MALPVLYERMTSRGFTEDRGGANFTGEFLAVGSTSETDVRQATISQTPVVYLGLVRKSMKASHRGGGYWDVTVDYGVIPVEEALGAQEPGQSSPTPATPASNDAPLGAGYSFSTTGQTTHITQSIATVSKTPRAPLIAPDFKQAIGVSLEGVEGCDIISPNFEFVREVRRNLISINYMKTLRDMTGTTNNATFYGHAAGEVLYLGCEGKHQTGQAWTLTHHFAVSKNKVNIVISDEITVLAKKGWEYLWVDYTPAFSEGRKIRKPTTAVVEQVYFSSNFAALEIGT